MISEVVEASLLHRVGVLLEGNKIILQSSCLCLGRDLCQCPTPRPGEPKEVTEYHESAPNRRAKAREETTAWRAVKERT
jgi:hypothetical protein